MPTNAKSMGSEVKCGESANPIEKRKCIEEGERKKEEKEKKGGGEGDNILES